MMKGEELAEYHHTEVWEQDYGIVVYGITGCTAVKFLLTLLVCDLGSKVMWHSLGTMYHR